MPLKTIKSLDWKRARLFLMVVALAGLVSLGAVTHADQFDAQIQALQDQNSKTQGIVNGLQAQASSYQDAINILQGQISALQAALAANEAEQASLQQQITDAQNKITEQKKLLGEVIKAMYIDGQMSTIEELATSKSLSDYVDQEENRTAVQNKVDDLIKQIANLEVQLQSQKDQLDIVVKTQQQQDAQLASDQAQQQSLLSYNEGQQAAYNSQIQSNQQQISILRAQQAAANRRLGGSDSAGDPGHGGYPAKWDYPVPQDSLIDSWGMFNRECVSYTAWKVYQTYGYMPYWGGSGNANQWPGDARAAGIPTGSTPRVHSVAISMAGAFGHAMWVESINPDGTINVSQYNKYLTGTYSESYGLNPSSFVYIYFGG